MDNGIIVAMVQGFLIGIIGTSVFPEAKLWDVRKWVFIIGFISVFALQRLT